jgi:transcriptional regulator NrdR family protein
LTTERIATHEVQVRKRSGHLEPFKRQKIARGIIKAASGQHLLPAVVDAFVERVVDELTPPPDGAPVTTKEIGELVLQSLDDTTDLTDVVRIRFAMVFLGRLGTPSSFVDAREFMVWLEANYPNADPGEGHIDEVIVVKRNGKRERFDVKKLERSVGIAAKGRGDDAKVRQLASVIAQKVLTDLTGQAIVTSQQIAASVLRQLRIADVVAYLRYASITKRYTQAADFFREASALMKAPDPGQVL